MACGERVLVLLPCDLEDGGTELGRGSGEVGQSPPWTWLTFLSSEAPPLRCFGTFGLGGLGFMFWGPAVKGQRGNPFSTRVLLFIFIGSGLLHLEELSPETQERMEGPSVSRRLPTERFKTQAYVVAKGPLPKGQSVRTQQEQDPQLV